MGHNMKRLGLKLLSMTIFQSALPVRQSPTKLVLAVVEILRLVLGEGATSVRPTSAKFARPAGIGSRVLLYAWHSYCYSTFFDRDICTEISIEFELCFELAVRRWRSPDTTSLVNIQKNSNSKHMLESSGQCDLVPDLHSQKI
jgi:hypothetical protein